ncbi:MAG: bacillithiol biosynthesis cysteine-adding enzyme BshC [Rhodothermales bacterium]|nr:bacillithiol biosynthesis cysteine-adding enzyme BshC [Rhodothermales bacterium]
MHATPAYQHVPSLPYAALSASSLFVDYCTRYGSVAPFYSGDFRNPEHLRAALDRTLAVDRNRDALVDALHAQQTRWGVDDATRASLDALRSPRAGVVITGQQLGLFVSPLYTIYKTLTTIQLARQLSASTGHPVVPVFWMAGEDHDFREIATTTLVNSGSVTDLSHAETPLSEGEVNAGPVGRLRLDGTISSLIDQLASALPTTEFSPEWRTLLREAYAPGALMEDAFARVLKRLTQGTGLILASIDDPAMKRLAVPLFEREVRDFAGSFKRLAETSAELLHEGYHAQVATRPTNLFMMEEEGRLPIDAEDGRFILRGTSRSYSPDDLLALVRTTPERFSPNVVLRPLIQDLLFPTVAYVAGPGETAYFAQYRELYTWAGVPMPIIYPRVSVSLIDPTVRKYLDFYPFALPEYAKGTEWLLKQTAAAAMPESTEAVFAEANRAIDAQLDALKARAGEIDATLNRSADAARAKISRVVNRLHDRAIRGYKRSLETDRARLDRITASLFPHGKPQERVLSPFVLINQYGLDVFTRLMDRLPLDTWEHHVIEL